MDINDKCEMERLQRDNHYLNRRMEEQDEIIRKLIREMHKNGIKADGRPRLFPHDLKEFLILLAFVIIIVAGIGIVVYFK